MAARLALCVPAVPAEASTHAMTTHPGGSEDNVTFLTQLYCHQMPNESFPLLALIKFGSILMNAESTSEPWKCHSI